MMFLLIPNCDTDESLSIYGRKDFARGVITDGVKWRFIQYRAAKDGKRAAYGETPDVELGDDCENLDLILGLLVDWVCSHSDLLVFVNR